MKFSTTITNSNIIGIPLPTILDRLVEAGFDAVDLPGEPDIYPIFKMVETMESYSGKIHVGEVTACINPTRDLMNPDKKARQNAVEYVKYCINAASELGVNLTHACFITTPEILHRTGKQVLERNAVESLQELASYARDAGVRLMLEPLFSGDNTIVKTARDATVLFSKALDIDAGTFMRGQNDFGLLLDIFHMHVEEPDLVKSIMEYASKAMHVHVADHPRSLDFMRSDSSFVKTGIAAFRAAGYQGYTSFESFHPSISFETLKTALCVIKTF